MGFLERLGELIQKNNEAQYKTNFKTNTALKFQVNTTDAITTSVDFDKFLALSEPAKFINKYINSDVIQNAINQNPNIEKILKDNGLEVSFEIENARSIIMSHLIPTAKVAQKIYSKIGHNQNEIFYLYLTQAALLHDIGKVFIPSSILNKKGKLSFKERRIVELHNKLSFEILRTTGLHQKVAQLCLEHHDYDKNLKRSEENQALTIADVYCALKEARPYKKPINDISARMILYDMGTKGSFDTRFINCI